MNKIKIILEIILTSVIILAIYQMDNFVEIKKYIPLIGFLLLNFSLLYKANKLISRKNEEVDNALTLFNICKKEVQEAEKSKFIL